MYGYLASIIAACVAALNSLLYFAVLKASYDSINDGFYGYSALSESDYRL